MLINHLEKCAMFMQSFIRDPETTIREKKAFVQGRSLRFRLAKTS